MAAWRLSEVERRMLTYADAYADEHAWRLSEVERLAHVCADVYADAYAEEHAEA